MPLSEYAALKPYYFVKKKNRVQKWNWKLKTVPSIVEKIKNISISILSMEIFTGAKH